MQPSGVSTFTLLCKRCHHPSLELSPPPNWNSGPIRHQVSFLPPYPLSLQVIWKFLCLEDRVILEAPKETDLQRKDKFNFDLNGAKPIYIGKYPRLSYGKNCPASRLEHQMRVCPRVTGARVMRGTCAPGSGCRGGPAESLELHFGGYPQWGWVRQEGWRPAEKCQRKTRQAPREHWGLWSLPVFIFFSILFDISSSKVFSTSPTSL